MSNSSPGPGTRVLTKLTPHSQRTLSQESNSYADSIILSKELSVLRTQANLNNDVELLNEIMTLENNVKKNSYRKRVTYLYSADDRGPFTVFIESKNQNIGNLNPLSIGKMFFMDKQFSLKINKISRKGKKRVGVDFSTGDEANSFVGRNNFDSDEYDVYIPANMVSIMGVVTDVDFDITEDDILSFASSSAKILKFKRLKKRDTSSGEVLYKDTKACVLTFQGRILPSHVSLFHTYIEVAQYVSPVIQCFQCLRYGHTIKLCNGRKRCQRCGDNHDRNDCTSSSESCVHCQGAHRSVDRACPEYERQRKIREAMAFHNYSFYEANKILSNKTARINMNPNSFPPLPSQNMESTEPLLRSSRFPKRQSYAHVATQQSTRQTLSQPSLASGSQQAKSTIVNLNKFVRNNPAPTVNPHSPKKRNKPNQGYDREAHKRALFDYRPGCTGSIPLTTSERNRGPTKIQGATSGTSTVVDDTEITSLNSFVNEVTVEQMEQSGSDWNDLNNETEASLPKIGEELDL